MKEHPEIKEDIDNKLRQKLGIFDGDVEEKRRKEAKAEKNENANLFDEE